MTRGSMIWNFSHIVKPNRAKIAMTSSPESRFNLGMNGFDFHIGQVTVILLLREDGGILWIEFFNFDHMLAEEPTDCLMRLDPNTLSKENCSCRMQGGGFLIPGCLPVPPL